MSAYATPVKIRKIGRRSGDFSNRLAVPFEVCCSVYVQVKKKARRMTGLLLISSWKLKTSASVCLRVLSFQT
jgi:hypothetical protein